MANSVTAQQVLLKVAEDLNELHSAFVDNVSGAQVRAAGLSLGPEVNFQYGIATIEGKGVRTILTYYEADEKIVLDSAFSPAAVNGDILLVAWWDAAKRGKAQRAINQAILASYPYWFREIALDLNTINLYGLIAYAGGVYGNNTLPEFAAGTYRYLLPSNVTFLSRVGVQTDASKSPFWTAPLNVWRVVGEEGGLELRFNTTPVDMVTPNIGSSICFHYEARATPFQLFSASETCELPLDYFTLAAEIYRRRTLTADDTGLSLARATGLAAEAQRVLGRIGVIKSPLPRGPKYRW